MDCIYGDVQIHASFRFDDFEIDGIDAVTPCNGAWSEIMAANDSPCPAEQQAVRFLDYWPNLAAFIEACVGDVRGGFWGGTA